MEEIQELLIIGVILGIFILLLGLLIYMCLKRKKKKVDNDDDYSSDDEPKFMRPQERNNSFMIPFTFNRLSRQLPFNTSEECLMDNTEFTLKREDYIPHINPPTAPAARKGTHYMTRTQSYPDLNFDEKVSDSHSVTSERDSVSLGGSDGYAKKKIHIPIMKRHTTSMIVKQQQPTTTDGHDPKSKRSALELPDSRQPQKKISVYEHTTIDVSQQTLARRRSTLINQTESYKKAGMIHFSTEYFEEDHRLEVYISRASKLSPKRLKTHINSFVRLCLYPGKKQRQDTKVIHKTNEPKFEEMISFQGMEREELTQHKLKIKVYNHDMLRKNEILGQVDILMSSISLNEKEMFDIFLFKKRSKISMCSVSITLCHQATFSLLEVYIDRLRRVPKKSPNSSIYGEVTLFRENTSISKSTNVKFYSKDPVFGEMFAFQIITNSSIPLSAFSLVFTLKERNIIGQDERLGHVIFNMGSPQSSSKNQWVEVQNKPHIKHTGVHYLVDPDEL